MDPTTVCVIALFKLIELNDIEECFVFDTAYYVVYSGTESKYYSVSVKWENLTYIASNSFIID